MSGWRERLSGAWYDPEARPPAWTRWLEPVYRLAVLTRRLLYRRGWLRSGHPGVPVVIVGNLTVGGAGKTPLVILVAQLLMELGRRPAVVSRGYGGAEPRQPHRVREHDSPAFAGDEPLLLAKTTACPVWICRDRLAAARAAAAGGADVIVADDGLQHYRLRRDFEIVVVDGVRGLGNGRCLPAGPLREPSARLGEADLVVCNGEGHCPPGSVRMALVGDQAVRIDASARRSLAAFAPGPVHGIAGIGHPQRFFDFLAGHGLEVVPHPLPDHGRMPAGLLSPHDGLPVLMTSKDAVRCARMSGSGACWEVPVTADLGADASRFRQALAGRLGMSEA